MVTLYFTNNQNAETAYMSSSIDKVKALVRAQLWGHYEQKDLQRIVLKMATNRWGYLYMCFEEVLAFVRETHFPNLLFANLYCETLSAMRDLKQEYIETNYNLEEEGIFAPHTNHLLPYACSRSSSSKNKYLNYFLAIESPSETKLIICEKGIPQSGNSELVKDIKWFSIRKGTEIVNLYDEVHKPLPPKILLRFYDSYSIRRDSAPHSNVLFFVGPDEAHFSPSCCSRKKLETLVYKAILIEGEKGIFPIQIKFRPDTGFADLVLNAIKRVQKNNSDIKLKVILQTELEKDLEKIPEDVKSKFLSIDTVSQILACSDAKCLSQESLKSTFASNYAVYYFFEEDGMVYNSRYVKELETVKNRPGSVNLVKCCSETLKSSSGIRKRPSAGTYYYRLNFKHPDGHRVVEEKGGYISYSQAKEARMARLRSLMQQKMEVGRTLEDAFNEYLNECLVGKISLQKKYISYFNSYIRAGQLHDVRIEDFVQTGLSVLQSLVRDRKLDNRRKSEGSSSYVSAKYHNGFKVFLVNLFDYAYKQKYISTHPFYTDEQLMRYMKEGIN